MDSDDDWTPTMRDWVARNLAASGPLTPKQLDVIRAEFGQVAAATRSAA